MCDVGLLGSGLSKIVFISWQASDHETSVFSYFRNILTFTAKLTH